MMKLKDMKFSELKEICSRYKCFQCPIWDEKMGCCFFTVSRIPCQWRIEDDGKANAGTRAENQGFGESD